MYVISQYVSDSRYIDTETEALFVSDLISV